MRVRREVCIASSSAGHKHTHRFGGRIFRHARRVTFMPLYFLDIGSRYLFF